MSVLAAATRERPAPPVRIVHLGVGAFSRSHTAWYTAHAGDSHEWGIAAFTGRSPGLAHTLTEQDCVYTLVERSVDGDHDERIESIVRAHPGTDTDRLIDYLAAPETAIVTFTITEAGYRTAPTGGLNLDDPLVLADLEAITGVSDVADLTAVPVQTALGRLVVGLEARRRAGGGPLALVSCDNLPDNGGVLRRSVMAFASVSDATATWCARSLAFVSSSVDRITPRLTAGELALLVRRYGDRAPVVAEPFSDWVLSGEFPAGRPRWEDGGARFTDELEPWEARKLWMLNGAHTLLATLGALRGHEDVAGAIADPECRAAVDALWDEAVRHLPVGLELDDYRTALLERFANPRIEHLLAQIALDSMTKVRLRIAPVAERERDSGRSGSAGALAIASWIVADGVTSDAAEIRNRVAGVSGQLAADDDFVAVVSAMVRQVLNNATVTSLL